MGDQRDWSPGRLLGVEELLRTWDRLAEIRARLTAEGLEQTSNRSGLARRHPLLADELRFTKLFDKRYRELHLKWHPVLDGRM